MNNYGLLKGTTSLLRWIIHVLAFLVTPRSYEFLLMSPPMVRTQVAYERKSRELFRFRILSYQDWATAYHVFGIGGYSLKKVGLEERIRNAYEQRNETRPTILDLGANIGLTSLYYSRLYPEAKIIGVELDLENFRKAALNLADRSNVKLIHAAISSFNGTGYRLNPGLGNNAYRLSLESDEENHEVKTISVPSIMEEFSVAEILLAKIDIEGSEAQLFESNTEWVSKTKLIVMETHDWLMPGHGTSVGFFRTIAGQNRDFLHKGENVYSVAND